MGIEIKTDTVKLEKLIKNLKGKHYVDIGLLGEKGADSNVIEYGSVHEFGSISKNIPERSFIKMPIETKQNEIAADAKKNFEKHLEEGDIKAIFKDIGISAEAQIQDAFSTGGFGTWEPLSERYLKFKEAIGKTSILIIEGTLRKSITSKAV